MTERISSDHEAIESHRVELAAVGRTGRARVPLPATLDCEEADTLELTVDGMQLFAVVETTISGELTISGAYENRRRARTLDGTNHLRQWFDSNGLVPGSTVLLDVVTAGYAYGLREPGTRVVYEASDPPDSSLTDIAESLGE